MMLIVIGEPGCLSEDLAADDFLRGVIKVTVAHYQHIGFVPPWIGYIVVENEVPLGVWGFKGPPTIG